MHIILINKDNTATTTQNERIMQRSKLVDTLCFMVEPTYNDLNIIECTALMEYVLPISRKYSTETLVASETNYKGYLRYLLPVDTSLTSEAGDIDVSLTFIYVGINSGGKVIQRVRKIQPTTITVHPSTNWSEVIPDSALSAVDQRIIKTEAQIRALQDMSTMFNITKADNIRLHKDTSELQLLAGDMEIGDRVKLHTIDIDEEVIEESLKESLKEGIPVVDFGSSVPDDPGIESPEEDGDGEETDNVVEF